MISIVFNSNHNSVERVFTKRADAEQFRAWQARPFDFYILEAELEDSLD